MILLIFFINAMKLKSKMKVKEDENNLDEEEVPNIVVEKIDEWVEADVQLEVILQMDDEDDDELDEIELMDIQIIIDEPEEFDYVDTDDDEDDEGGLLQVVVVTDDEMVELSLVVELMRQVVDDEDEVRIVEAQNDEME